MKTLLFFLISSLSFGIVSSANSWGCEILDPNNSYRCLKCADGYYHVIGGNSDACYLCNREPWNSGCQLCQNEYNCT